jgi:hypothetical protein
MIYNFLMAFGVVVVAGIIVKGFRSAARVKPIEQPDNWRNYSPGGPDSN